MLTLPVCCSSFGVQQRVLGFLCNFFVILMYFDNKDDRYNYEFVTDLSQYLPFVL